MPGHRRARMTLSVIARSGNGGRKLSIAQSSNGFGSWATPCRNSLWYGFQKSDPGAEHDILSIDEDGKPIWTEVKSTMGTDGRFHWSQREFEKALREGKRYVLWRVYEAHTSHPSAKPFRDPIGLLARSALRLEIRSLEGVVESKSV